MHWTTKAYKPVGQSPRMSKHVHAATGPDGRVYFIGGDYQGNPDPDSYRQECWAYDPAADAWELVTPYCSPTLQPKRPDEVGWFWDEKRGRFWLIPGYMDPVAPRCADPSQAYHGAMTFDPTTREWAIAPWVFGYSGDLGTKHANYDPVTDTVIRFISTGNMGNGVQTWNLETGFETITPYRGLLPDGSGRMYSSLRFRQEQQAIDVQGRCVWALDGVARVLIRYDIDARTQTQITSSVPPDACREQDCTLLQWDPVRRHLVWARLWFYGSPPDNHGTLYRFDPSTGRWDSGEPMVTAAGQPIPITHTFVYHPGTDSLLVLSRDNALGVCTRPLLGGTVTVPIVGALSLTLTP